MALMPMFWGRVAILKDGTNLRESPESEGS